MAKLIGVSNFSKKVIDFDKRHNGWYGPSVKKKTNDNDVDSKNQKFNFFK